MSAWWLDGDPRKCVCVLVARHKGGDTYLMIDAMRDVWPVTVDDYGDVVVITGRDDS